MQTNWDKLLPAALDAIAHKRQRSPETGEIEELRKAIERILPTIVPMTSSVSPKQTGAKHLGIALNGFVERTDRVPQVTVSVRRTELRAVDPNSVSDMAALEIGAENHE